MKRNQRPRLGFDLGLCDRDTQKAFHVTPCFCLFLLSRHTRDERFKHAAEERNSRRRLDEKLRLD